MPSKSIAKRRDLSGRPNRLTEGQRRRAEAELRLAYWLAARCSASRPDLRDEIVSAAMFGLVVACRDYEEGGSFANYAKITMLGYIRKAVRDASALVTNVADLGLTVHVPDRTRSGGDDSFERLISGLDDRQRELIRLRYKLGMGMTEIGRCLGRDRSSVLRSLRTALRHLGALLSCGIGGIAKIDVEEEGSSDEAQLVADAEVHP